MSDPEGEGPRTSDLGPRPEEPNPEPSPDPEPSPSPSPIPSPGSEPEARSPTPEARDSAPILPNAYDEAALREAIGAKPKREKRAKTEPSPYGRVDDDDDDEPKAAKSRRKMIVVSAAVTLVGIAIAAAIFLGRANASRYLIECNADHVSAEQGRAFPPWGSHPIAGAEWKPITLPPNAECKPKETDDPDELAKWYLDLLVDRASSQLTSRSLLDTIPHAGAGGAAAGNPLDSVAAQLEQALLLARAPERRDQRKDIERLQGDVEYWRAAARTRDAAAALAEAAKQFDAAAALRPRHVDDASAWATFSRKVVDELHAGPNGVPPLIPGALPGEPHTPAPPGVALPVEPPATGSDTNATAAPPPDAGVPSGGVLL